MWFYLVGAFLLGATIGLLAGRYRWRRPQLDYAAARLDAIRMVADQFPKGSTLIFGDSLVEQCYFEGIISVAAAFATTRHIAAVAPDIIAKVEPEAVILSIGPNDLWEDREAFEVRYSALVDLIRAPKTVLVGIPNEDGPNRFILSLASSIGAVYVPPVTGERYTFDATHQTLEGKAEFRRRIAHALTPGPALKALVR